MFDGLFKAKLLGTPTAERYVIRDARGKGPERFWTGKGWTGSVRMARLFSSTRAMGRTVWSLTLSHLSRKFQPRTFTIELEVLFLGPDKVNREDVATYLRDALTIGLDYNKCGLGPTHNSMVMIRVKKLQSGGSPELN